jgi:hypothetical protein
MAAVALATVPEVDTRIALIQALIRVRDAASEKPRYGAHGTALMFLSMRRRVVKPPLIFTPSNKLPPGAGSS